MASPLASIHHQRTGLGNQTRGSDQQLPPKSFHHSSPQGHSYCDNTPVILWITQEASTINLVVADLLRICAIHYINLILNLYVFYSLGQENCMEDDDFCPFDFPGTPFLTHKPSYFPQPLSSWQLYPPTLELLLCVIYTLHRKSCKRKLINMRNGRGCTIS